MCISPLGKPKAVKVALLTCRTALYFTQPPSHADLMQCRVSADFDGMDGRREPRFQIYAPGKLTLVDSPERELECLLLDISATGMKFVADESLPVDEVVALEVEDHLVLADVRYSEPRGDKFVIGAERIHAVDKSALPQDKTSAEQIRYVVGDYRNRIRLAIAAETAQVKKPEPELPIVHRDQVVEAAVQRLIEQWAKDSEGSAPDGTLRAAIVERAAERVAERSPMPPPVTAQPAITAPPAIPMPPAMTAPLAVTAPPAISVTPARGVLSWRLPFLAAGAIAMMAFTASIFWSYRHSAAGGTRHAEIRVTEPAWVYAISDGKEVFGKLLARDETRQIDFFQKALVRVGNAGGVEISVDGKSIGPLGPRGAIRALEITPDGHRFVPLSAVAPEKN
jgi:hypothetical protein